MFIANTAEDVTKMLTSIGADSIESLFAGVPEKIRLRRDLDIPPGLDEISLTRHASALAAKNTPAGQHACFLGGGSYDHFIPAVIDAIASRSEYYTAYTPYQAEASQGSLQAFYEFQTMVCQLYGMEVANASLYEGGSAVAEAVMMASGIADKPGIVLVPESVHPEYRATLDTYLTNLNVKAVTLPTPGGFLDPADLKKALTADTIAVVLQQPNFFGNLEEAEELVAIAKSAGALAIVSADPIASGVLRRPGEYGADIVVGEGQPLGTPMGFGGRIWG